MDLTVELQPPLLRYNDGKNTFMRGVAKPVDLETARLYENNPRFKVAGLNTRAAIDAIATATRPQGAALHEAIRAATADLEPDDDANFDRHGKFSHLAISNVLGYSVSPEERDAALHGGASKPKLEAADPAPSTPITIIKKNPAAAAAPAKTATADPTTRGAID
jgi:hypothetical protein